MTIASSIIEATPKADIIFYSVPNDAAAHAVLKEILKADVKGKVVVNCSTVHPDTTTKEADAVNTSGGSFVACPVFGSASMADAGQLINVIAGNTEAVKKILPFCKGVISRETIDISGQGPELGALLKIIGNTVVLNIVIALAEGHVLAEKMGLGQDRLHKFIQVIFPGPCIAYSETMVNGNYYKREKPLGPAELGKKDSGFAQRLAKEAGMRLRTIEVAEHLAQQSRTRDFRPERNLQVRVRWIMVTSTP